MNDCRVPDSLDGNRDARGPIEFCTPSWMWTDRDRSRRTVPETQSLCDAPA